MDYKDYSAKDFALDKKFQNWVLREDSSASDFWTTWIKENPGKEAEITEARELIKLSGLSSDEEDNETYLRTWSILHQKASQAVAVKRRNNYVRVAAVFAGFIAVVAYLLINQPGEGRNYQTAFGEIQKISLPDGSVVTLNGNSVLKIKDDLNQAKDRVVTLEGEAFFEIAKTKDRKSFRVSTGNGVSVEVLGTVFNVDARDGKSTEVFLQEGKIKISHGADQMILNPGELAQVESAGRLAVWKATVEEQNVKLGWKNGQFVFNDTPLSQIVYDLQDDYGLHVVVMDSSLNQKRITAKVSGRNVDVLFKVLSETLDIKINREGTRVVISP
jgi:ferric-dicitrate binding protein FerR (iron transport regulator)